MANRQFRAGVGRSGSFQNVTGHVANSAPAKAQAPAPGKAGIPTRVKNKPMFHLTKTADQKRRLHELT